MFTNTPTLNTQSTRAAKNREKHQKRSRVLFLLLSVLIHSGVGFLALRGIPQITRNTPTQPVTIVQIQHTKTPVTQATPQKKKRALPTLQSLAPEGARLTFRQANTATEQERVGELTRDGFEVARTMDMNRESGIYPYMTYLHGKIKNALQYPENLVRKGRVGIVTVQFEINSRGKLASDLTVTHAPALGEDRKLVAVVIEQLKRILDETPHRQIHLPVERLKVVTNFDFRVFRHEELAHTKVPQIVKNILYFYPYAIRDAEFVRGGGSSLSGYTIGIDALKVKQILQN